METLLEAALAIPTADSAPVPITNSRLFNTSFLSFYFLARYLPR
jgi:hypothetical protein